MILRFRKYAVCPAFPFQPDKGFRYFEIEKGETFFPATGFDNYIYFLLEGRIRFTHDRFPEYISSEHEFILLTRDNFYRGEALTNLRMIVLFTGNELLSCYNVDMDEVQSLVSQVDYRFGGLNIKPILHIFLDSLRIYLINNVHCAHLHQIKIREYFLILRYFYPSDQVIPFFQPILTPKASFEDFIRRQSLKVKTVSELAAICNCSTRSLNRKFQSYFNMSPVTWLIQQKTMRIKGRLSNRSIPISHIIDEFNFASPAHFSNFCKKQLGMSPTAFRKQYAGMTDEKNEADKFCDLC